MSTDTVEIYTLCKKVVIGRVHPTFEDIAAKQLSLIIAKTFSDKEYEWHGEVVGSFYDNYIIPELLNLPE